MKKILFLFILWQFWFNAVSGQSNVTFYVSPHGKDTNPGTFDKPFATPEKALLSVTKTKQTNPEPVIIYFREGVYYRTNPLKLTEKAVGSSSAVTFKAYENEKVIFHGGRKLDGSKFKPCTDKAVLNRLLPEARGRVWMINLKKEGIADYGILKQHGFGLIPEPTPLELFINSEPQTLARYPNEGILNIGRVYDKGSIPRVGDFTNRGAEFGYEFDRPAGWTKANDIWLHGKFSYGFNDDNLKVERIDQDKKSFKVVQPHIYGVFSCTYANAQEQAGLSVRGYYAYNLLEEIDQPGEYYLDRNTGKLYVYPSSTLSESVIEVSLLESPFFSIIDASRIKIEGITFTCSRGMGIYLENTTDITVDHCTFSNLGTVAVSMGHALKDNDNGYNLDGSPKLNMDVKGDFKNIAISNCLVYNTGSGGVIVEGGDRKTLTPGNNLVYNTEFYRSDRINNSYSPAIKLYGVGNIVRNCYFHDLKHQSIDFMGNDLLVEYCRFDKVCTDADDMGTIYTGRNPSARGTVFQYNYLSNIEPRNKETSMCGIYFDDGAGGMMVKNNFFYKVGNPGHSQCFGAVFIHGGHDNKILNNIFMDCLVAIGHAAWDTEYWRNSLDKLLLKKRLREEVDIMGDVYQKRYPELKDYYTNIGRRLNLLKDNLLIRSQTTQFGDLMLRSNITINDAGTLPEKINYSEVKKQLPSVEPFPFEKVGIIKSAQ